MRFLPYPGGLVSALSLCIFLSSCSTQPHLNDPSVPTVYQPISLDDFYDAIKHWNDRTGETGVPHYALTEITQIADNLLRYQRSDGSWPTNKHPTRVLNESERAQLLSEKNQRDGSFDNRNIYPQIEYLLEVYAQTQNEPYRAAALAGLNYTLSKQYANGGFAHSPDRTDFAYYQHITFADDIMPGVLGFLRKVMAGTGVFAAVPADLQARAADAVVRGDALILQLQIRQPQGLSAWAGQYDQHSLTPATGRSFELPGVLAWESVPVVEYLMSIPNPSAEVIAAVDAAIAWFTRVQISGLRVEKVAVDAQRFEYHAADYDLVMMKDVNAPPLWARFYDLQTNQPFLANRDGQRVYRLSDVAYERRTGYSWYGDWPAPLIAEKYPRWRATLALEKQ